jgi:protein TonB
MASPAELGPLLPDTLPEDFGEWDNGESQSDLSAGSNGMEAALAPAPRQSAPILEPRVVVTPKVEAMRREPSPLAPQPTPQQDQEAFLRQLHAIGNGLDRSGLERPSSPAPQAQQAARTAKEPAFAPAQSNGSGANGSRNALSPAPKANGTRAAQSASPASASTDDEAFLRQLKEIGSALNSQPAPTQGRSASRATEEVATPQARSNVDEGRRWPAKPVLATAGAGGAAAVGFPSFHSGLEEAGDENPLRKKWMMIAAVSLASIVLLAFLGMRFFGSSKPSLAKQSVTVVQPTVTETDPVVDTRKPSPSIQLATGKPPAPTQDEMAAAAAAPAPVDTNSTPSPEAAQNMSDQLAASPRISRDIKEKAKEDAPPPAAFSADGMSGSSAVNPVFGKQSHPTISYVAPQPVAISAGVAGGLLIHRTEPIYPQIAKATRVEGTVVIQANVTKSGSLSGLHVISGPAMLRQAALDAVTTWRYKPYLVNNVPTEVQTTVSVVFRLGQ